MGIFIIISSPSGGGKNTVVQSLLRQIPGSVRFVTTTTRPARPGEIEGKDYHFLEPRVFEEKMRQQAFVEVNQYAAHWYGTDKALLMDALQKYPIVFGALDVHGKAAFDTSNIPHRSIFLVPEDLGALEERIRRRGGVTEGELQDRLAIAQAELAAADAYDYRVVNTEGGVEEAAAEIVHILDSEGLL